MSTFFNPKSWYARDILHIKHITLILENFSFYNWEKERMVYGTAGMKRNMDGIYLAALALCAWEGWGYVCKYLSFLNLIRVFFLITHIILTVIESTNPEGQKKKTDCLIPHTTEIEQE